MRTWLRELDELLRGRIQRPADLIDDSRRIRLRRFVPMAIVLGAIYGFFMGWYSIISREPAVFQQAFASMVKLPALFLITLVVTFPSLYVFNAMLGSRLGFTATLKLLVSAIVVNVTVAASLGPILGFFTLSTTSYPFMIILNVVLMGLSGAVSLGFLLHTLRRLSWIPVAGSPPAIVEDESEGDAEPSPNSAPVNIEYAESNSFGESRSIFRIWVLIYGLVGAQTGWLLRPFIGSPNMEFTWFRERDGNFFISVWNSLQLLLNG